MPVFKSPQVLDAATGRPRPELVGQEVTVVYVGTTTPVPITEYGSGVTIAGSVLTVGNLFTLTPFVTPAGVYEVEVLAADGTRAYLETAEGARLAALAAEGNSATSAAAAGVSAAAAIAAQTAAEAAPLPGGGSSGQALIKASAADRDVTWGTVAGGGGGGGVTVHGQLSGLTADDHPQYHNDNRGDARYYPRATVDQLVGAAATAASSADRNRANHTGTQAVSTVSGLETRLSTLEAGGGGGGGPVTTDNITDATTTGKNVLRATSQANARAAIGAGTSSVAIGTGAGTAADAAAVTTALAGKVSRTETYYRPVVVIPNGGTVPVGAPVGAIVVELDS